MLNENQYCPHCETCDPNIKAIKATHQLEKVEQIGPNRLVIQHYFCKAHAPEDASPVTWRYVE